MATKLTLSIDAGTIKKIKQYSKEEGISISKIAEEHFNKIASIKDCKKLDITKLMDIIPVLSPTQFLNLLKQNS